MLKKTLIITALFCLFSFKSCSGNYEIEPTRGIGGSWKLVKMEIVTNDDFENAEIIDYSEYNCIYEFTWQENYKKVDYHWTPKWKLFVYNNVPARFPNEIQAGSGECEGAYYYQYRFPSDCSLPDGTHIDYSCNLKISRIDGYYKMALWCFVNYENGIDIMTIGTGQNGQFIDEYGNALQWTKYFVRIKE